MNFQSLFSPQSIAVVGASMRSGNVGNDIVKNLVMQGFSGGIYPVNPHAEELYGKKCYPNVLDIEEEIELVVIVVPAPSVVVVAREAIKKGAGAIVVISAGFREIGNSADEEILRSLCDAAGVVLLGPNCLGVINPSLSMNASFASRIPKVGSIAFLSQSGALCTAMLDYADGLKLGFSKFVSLGNKAQIDEVALMHFLESDPDTKIVVLYIEQLTNAKEFVAAVQSLRKRGKPVLVVKSGSTSAGAGASASHTGALAGNDAVYEALFKKAGAIRVRDFDDLFEYLSGFEAERYGKGDRVVVLTNAGGPGVLTTDEIILQDLQLAELSQETKRLLRSFLPVAASSNNPVDILGDADAERYRKSLEILLKDDGVDVVVVVLTPQSMTQIVETAVSIKDLFQTTQKPIFTAFMGATDTSEGVQILRACSIPVSQFPQKVIRTLAVVRRFSQLLNRQEIESSDESILQKNEEVEKIVSRYPNGGDLSFTDALSFFEAHGMVITRSVSIREVLEARNAVEEVGGTAVFKILSSDIVHKSDVGGVALSVTTDRAEEEFKLMMSRLKKNVPNAHIDGILVAEMITKKNAEFILGSVKDPNLGHAIMVGFGGVYVEVFRDVVFGLVPVSAIEAQEMIEQLKSKALLRGARGGDILDEQKLVESIVIMSHILEIHPEINEADINPLAVFTRGEGVQVLDARVSLISGKSVGKKES